MRYDILSTRANSPREEAYLAAFALEFLTKQIYDNAMHANDKNIETKKRSQTDQ